MPINIKNERVSSLVMELSAATGKSITEVVGMAVEAQLDELRRERARAGMAEKLMEIGRRCVSHAPADWLAKDFDEELYDEAGMPR